jgi:c(7)-type cytochrome triheme protein
MRTWALLLVVAAACNANGRGVASRPIKTDTIIFSHDFHVKQLEFDCDTCHKGVTESTDLAARSFLPKEATCLDCHGDKKTSATEGECGFCHVDAKNPGTYAARELASRFPHVRHAPPAAECARCHVALSELPAKPGKTAADHDSCFSCHQHEKDYVAGTCDSCHDDLTRFATAPVASFSHAGDFLRTHGEQARTSAATCANCHDQTMCAECHSKTVSERVEVKFPEDVVSRFIHRGDFVSRHHIEARADSQACGRCHGQSFCDSCHTANNLTARAPDPRSPHPGGWSLPGAADFHGDAARRDIASCASCHDQGAASNCVDCHKVGGIGGNPHPASWLSRHETSEIASNGMCLACH